MGCQAMKLDVDHYLVLGVARTADARDDPCCLCRAGQAPIIPTWRPGIPSSPSLQFPPDHRRLPGRFPIPTARALRCEGAGGARRRAGPPRAGCAQARGCAGGEVGCRRRRWRKKLFGKCPARSRREAAVKSRPAASRQDRCCRPACLPRAAGPSAARRRDGAPALDPGRRGRAADLHRGRRLSRVTRAVKGPGLQVMAAETARPVEAPPVSRPRRKPGRSPSPAGAAGQPAEPARLLRACRRRRRCPARWWATRQCQGPCRR